MRIEAIRLGPAIALHVPGAPYYAISSTFHGAMEPHRNVDYVEITAIAGGEGRLTTYFEGGRTRVERLLPGQMHLFRPIDVQRIESTGDDGVDVLNIAFPLTAWHGYARLAELDPALLTSAHPPLALFDPADPDALRPHRRAVERFWNGPTMLDLIEFWTAVVPRFSRHPASGTAPGSPPWLTDALEALREEENLRGGIERFLELAHVSPAHLWRSTRRFCGMTPTDLITQLRLRHATMLLATSTVSVAEIAERCGFASPSYFSRAFRRAHTVSPREYRGRRAGAPPGP
jgi:AraC-like DNA-binding protein